MGWNPPPAAGRGLADMMRASKIAALAAAALAFAPASLRMEEAPASGKAAQQENAGKVFDLRTRAELQDRVLSSPVPVLLEFGAEWCAPCLKTAPMLDSLAASRPNALRVVKVDIDKDEIDWGQDPALADFRIRGIPHFLAVSNGRVVAKKAGIFGSAEEMAAWLDAAAPKTPEARPAPPVLAK